MNYNTSQSVIGITIRRAFLYVISSIHKSLSFFYLWLLMDSSISLFLPNIKHDLFKISETDANKMVFLLCQKKKTKSDIL